MFSGQGSHYFQMGKELYEQNRIFRDWIIRLDDITRCLSGLSVVETLYAANRGKADPFNRTLLTHPATFMVEYSLAQTLIEAGIRPDMVLGVSLGAFAAAAVAGFIGVEDALTGVVRQALALEECCDPGGMIAILAEPALFTESFLSSRSELAAVNFSSQFVVSAKERELAEIEATLKRRGISYWRLPVSCPFHSRWIDQAKGQFDLFMLSVRCNSGRVPLACCDQVAILSGISSSYFWDVIRHPIHFRETTARLEQKSCRRYIDVGPAGTLATFLRYDLPVTSRSTVHSILTPYGFDQKNLAALVASSRP